MTGLAVVDTGTTFSVFGQIVILVCLQIGGLGLMTFETVFLVVTGKRLAIADRIAIQESFTHTPSGEIKTLIGYIITAAFVIEAVGASLLTVHWYRVGRYGSFGETVYHAVFHSISAFCNAGFALYSDKSHYAILCTSRLLPLSAIRTMTVRISTLCRARMILFRPMTFWCCSEEIAI